MKNIIAYITLFVTLALTAVGCIEDDIDTSTGAQPAFSIDTLDLGATITGRRTATHAMVIHNPNSKGISLADVTISGPNADCYRINVDGIAGNTFKNIEIRAKDSIYVFVDGLFPRIGQPGHRKFAATLDVTANGRTQQLPIVATAADVEILDGKVFDQEGEVTLSPTYPYLVMDSLVVAPHTRLVIEPGVQLLFHDKARLMVRGTLIANGTAEQPIVMTGDRTDNVVGNIPFELMSRQWDGVWFTSTSHHNRLSFTQIRNTTWGVTVDSVYLHTDQIPSLALNNCVLTNSGDVVLDVRHSTVMAWATQFTEASNGLVRMHGGEQHFAQCTFANNYLFTAISGPALALTHTGLQQGMYTDDDGSGMPFAKLQVTNSIIYGYGAELSPANVEGADVHFDYVLMKSAGEDDDNFSNCLWDTDPLFYTVREDYLFDYRVKPNSPAVGAANASLTPAWSWATPTDFYGIQLGNVLGALTPGPAEE